jgi:hypothetical protein
MSDTKANLITLAVLVCMVALAAMAIRWTIGFHEGLVERGAQECFKDADICVYEMGHWYPWGGDDA